jgi:uncharacterized protein (TIRG00374 family)
MKIAAFFPLIGIAIFAFLLLNINISKTVQILSGTNLLLISLSAVIVIPLLFLKAFKWKLIVGMYDKSYPIKTCVKDWTKGFSLSIVTPGRLGDLSRAYYIKDRTGIGKGLTTVVIDRVTDVAILFSMAILGFLSFLALFTAYSSILFTVSALFALFVLAVYLSTKREVTRFILKPVFDRVVPEKHKSGIHFTFHEFYSGIHSVKNEKRQILLAVVIGVFVWIVSLGQYFLLALALGLNVPFLFLLSVMPIVALLDSLPISFSGIGTRDAALIMFFAFISVQKEYAVSFSLLVLFLGYIIIGSIGAFFILKDGRKKGGAD